MLKRRQALNADGAIAIRISGLMFLKQWLMIADVD